MSKDKKQARIEFGNYLKFLLSKAGLFAKDIASLIDCSPQYITEISKGRSMFTADQFNLLYEKLDMILDGRDIEKLVDYFIEAKAGFDMGQINRLEISDWEYSLINKTRLFTQSQKRSFDVIAEQYIENNREMMEQNERSERLVAEEPGEYTTPETKKQKKH